MLSPAAQVVRSAFLRYRRMIHPEYRDSERWKVCWEKAAKFIETHECEVDEYVAAQFFYTRPFPMPNQLYSDFALKKYENYTKTDVGLNELFMQLETELNYLSTRQQLGFDIDDILASKPAPLSPLFRYVMALYFKRPALAEVYRVDAREQLNRFQKTKEVYEKLVGVIPWP